MVVWAHPGAIECRNSGDWQPCLTVRQCPREYPRQAKSPICRSRGAFIPRRRSGPEWRPRRGGSWRPALQNHSLPRNRALRPGRSSPTLRRKSRGPRPSRTGRHQIHHLGLARSRRNQAPKVALRDALHPRIGYRYRRQAGRRQDEPRSSSLAGGEVFNRADS
jgi:hypothetical protein